jgi:LPS export ABC transporter permease LptG/LPS export ABC transporter permease LptF
MLRLIDRYVLKEVLPPFLLALLVFTFILIIPPIMEEAERLIEKGVSAAAIARILLTLLPQALGVTIPMALLIGLLIGLGRLSGDRETVALQACGVSIYRLLRPVLILAAAAWAATSHILIVAVPDANQRYREIVYDLVQARVESDVKPRVFFEDFPGMVLYVRDLRPQGFGWADVFLADTRQPGRTEIFLAGEGWMVLDRERRRVELVLEDGTRHSVPSESPETYEMFRYQRMTLMLDPDAVFPRTTIQRGDRELSIAELRAQVREFREHGLSPHRPIMEIQKKFSIPVAVFVFALIGLALGVTSRRDGKLASFALGIGVIFVYYVIMYLGEAMAKAGVLPAETAMWLPNIILGAFGIVLLGWRATSAERRLALPWSPRIGGAQPEADPSSVGAPSRGPTAGGKRVVVVIRFPQFWMPRPNILDWYVGKLYLRVIGLAFVGMLGIFYIATFIDLSDKLFKGETTGATLLTYFWFATPQFIYYVLPISALVSALVTIGLLTKTSELVVMKACGISLYRAAAPLLVFGALWSGTLFGLEESVLASANRRAEAIRHEIRGGSPRTFNVLNRRWIVGRKGDIYHYAYFDPASHEFDGLSIYGLDPDDWRLTRRLFAARVAHRSRWIARQGWVREFGQDAEPTSFATFDQRPLALEPPDYFITEQPDADRMSYRQLKAFIGELEASGFSVVRQTVALQRKLSFPFVTVIMTLIAVPFAVTTGRRGAMYGVGLGLVLAMAYWMVISVFGAIGSAGLIAPVLAAWAPNFLFGAGAVYLLLTVRT